ncbi:MAG: hypothetical protein ABWY30_09530 [Microterricola sp.]
MHTTILELVTRFAQASNDTEFDPDTVTPGIWGFVATALVAVAVVFLGFDMVRRIRRTNYKAEINEKLEAELAARDAEQSAAPDAPATPADPDAPASAPDTKP